MAEFGYGSTWKKKVHSHKSPGTKFSGLVWGHLVSTLPLGVFNPLILNGDQHQFSPNDIHSVNRLGYENQ